MPDLGRPLQFGYFLVPDASTPLLDTAQDVERHGLEYLAVQDHPYQRRFVDTWVLLSAVGATTTRLRLLPDVANLPLRPPAVLAKTAASLDVLTGGRVELGLGAGGFWDAIEAYGGPRRTPGEALAALAEAVEVIRLVWSGERNLRFAGEHYRLAGAHSGPVPAHRIGIWLGVMGPRALRLAGRVADGWLPSLRDDVGSLAQLAAQLDEAASDAGRDPADIRRVVNVGAVTGREPAGFDASRWVDLLTELALGPGFDTFLLGGPPSQLAPFAEDVVPAVRSLVADERAG
jgi:alkanesulfonate monooxygenase SsuD/methylene tetrahydromethanopterin reductase-like flavin-dependent oxidoreductase (luciferase family)